MRSVSFACLRSEPRGSGMHDHENVSEVFLCLSQNGLNADRLKTCERRRGGFATSFAGFYIQEESWRTCRECRWSTWA